MSEHKAEVLQRAAGIIERDGWTKGQYQDEDSGAVCMSGAIALAILEIQEERGMYGWLSVDSVAEAYEGPYSDLLWPIIEEQHPDWWELYWSVNATVAAFNDYDERTKEEVIAVLEKGAVRTREEVGMS